MAETKRRYRMGLLFVAGCCMLKIGNPKKKIFRRGRPNTQGPRPEYSLKQAEFGRLSARAEINTVYHICPNSNGALLLASTSSNTETAVLCIPSTRYRSKSKNAPRTCYFISETEWRTYFVTKSIGIGPKRVRDALQQVAEAFQWLYGIPAPSGVEIGSIEGALMRTPKPGRKYKFPEREARSDMDEVCLIDFDLVGLLPESFVSWTMDSSLHSVAGAVENTVTNREAKRDMEAKHYGI
ncbi:hypothetical protein K438DRAFT_1787731 [Mycena galopus ATCC 62051]|nr:hypothetical protein K438DRAFT_1787731 [Mycena galopus ATCC 62051]